ncbi:MAG: DUF3667 domain-containing protein [Muribaculaceae bacterium]|nr:DUF3667 domain-containing protein [Muribaculaceae bacterium]
MNIKAVYRRFRQWQLAPFEYKYSSQDSHRCNNCGHDYVGNFCPMCSQKQNVGPITWKSVIQSIGEVWGLHNRSLLYSVVQLFLRPGYFISDYISGKKQVSFPPVKMLALVALLGLLVDYLTGAIDGMFGMTFEEDEMLFLDNVLMWMNTHPDLMSMFFLSYLIIPVYFIFRFAPRNTRHTLPQGFFIQVFSSVLFLFLNMLYDITSMGWFVFVLGVVALFVTYKQLFGYGIWGTAWRLAAAMVCAVLFLFLLLSIDNCIHMFRAGHNDLGIRFAFFFIPFLILVFVGILWISYAISKPRSKKRKPKSAPAEPASVAPAEPEPAKPATVATTSASPKATPAGQKTRPKHKASKKHTK